jgi:hypothetical protein
MSSIAETLQVSGMIHIWWRRGAERCWCVRLVDSGEQHFCRQIYWIASGSLGIQHGRTLVDPERFQAAGYPCGPTAVLELDGVHQLVDVSPNS